MNLTREQIEGLCRYNEIGHMECSIVDADKHLSAIWNAAAPLIDSGDVTRIDTTALQELCRMALAWLDMQPRPISEAPTNAEPILIYLPRHERKPWQEVFRAHEYEGGPEFWSTPHGPNGRGYTILPEAPTHFIPLSSLPQVKP